MNGSVAAAAADLAGQILRALQPVRGSLADRVAREALQRLADGQTAGGR